MLRTRSQNIKVVNKARIHLVAYAWFFPKLHTLRESYDLQVIEWRDKITLFSEACIDLELLIRYYADVIGRKPSREGYMESLKAMCKINWTWPEAQPNILSFAPDPALKSKLLHIAVRYQQWDFFNGLCINLDGELPKDIFTYLKGRCEKDPTFFRSIRAG
jgi:hypothetical protein